MKIFVIIYKDCIIRKFVLNYEINSVSNHNQGHIGLKKIYKVGKCI